MSAISFLVVISLLILGIALLLWTLFGKLQLPKWEKWLVTVFLVLSLIVLVLSLIVLVFCFLPLQRVEITPAG